MKAFTSIIMIIFISLYSLFAGENCWTQTSPANWTILDIAIDPINPDKMYFAGWRPDEYGAYKSIDGGENWVPMTDLPIDNSYLRIAIAPSSPNIIFITLGMFSPASIYKSIDYGIRWHPADNGTETIGVDIAVDPSHPNTVYYAETYPYKSIDGGQNWFMIGEGITNYYCYDIVINPINPNILYVCSIAQYFPAMIYKSTNGGGNWEEKINGIPEGVDIHHIMIDPNNPEILYAGLRSPYPDLIATVYKTINGGENWFEIDNGLPDTQSAPPCLALDPLRPNIIYAGFNYDGVTVYRSTNGGESWESFNVGLPEYEIKALAVSPTTPPKIFAGTVNHGIWVYTDTTVGIDNSEIKIMNYGLQNYPNPFNPTTTISFGLKNKQWISLCLYNLKGQKVKTIFEGVAKEGKSLFTLNANDLVSGVYLYKLKTKKNELVKKCILLK